MNWNETIQDIQKGDIQLENKLDKRPSEPSGPQKPKVPVSEVTRPKKRRFVLISQEDWNKFNEILRKFPKAEDALVELNIRIEPFFME